MGRRWVVAGAVSLVLAGIGVACFVDVPDVIADAGPDVVIPPSCEAGACGAAAGFQPVLFSADRNAACPNGTTSFDVVANPMAGAGACTCDCNITQQPSCVPQVLVHHSDTTGPPTCGTVGNLWLSVDGGCNTPAATHVLYNHWALPPAPVVDAGTCTSVATGNPSAVSSAPARMCLDATCTTACTPAVGFSQCFQAAGDVPCPANLKKKGIIGASIAITCSACSACSIEVDGGCQGTLTLYGDTACLVALEAPLAVDGGCVANAALGQAVASFQYTPALEGLTCTPGTSAPTSVSLTQPQTICCP